MRGASDERSFVGEGEEAGGEADREADSRGELVEH